jgi:3-dehydroquinate dehydratase/pimeloyl-ACP methyl ester carboxylesterase
MGIEVEEFQSNHEGALIDRLHSAPGTVDGVVINPGALTHYSYALHDALVAIEVPTVEVHISNIQEREPWRRASVVSPACVYSIIGRGVAGYRWALRHLFFRAAAPFETHSYGPEPAQVGDLRRPAGAGPHPLAVLIHGGFWLDPWTRDLMDGLAVDLAGAGFVTWNVEYRRLGGGGGWPATFLDAAGAIEAGAQFHGVDPSRMVVVGHSAGGHLALWAAARRAAGGGSAAPGPPLVVGLGAVTDLPRAAEEGTGYGAVDRLLAGAGINPAEFSPFHMLPIGCQQLLAVGTEDAQVPPGFSRDYVSRALAAGDDASLLEIGGAGHFDFLDPNSPAWQEVRRQILSFFP